MFCRKCGKGLSTSIKFCGSCGTPSRFFKGKYQPIEAAAKAPRDKYVSPIYSEPKPFYKTAPIQPEVEATPNVSRIFVILAVVSILVISSLWTYKNYGPDEEEIETISETQNATGATLHIQLNSWRTVAVWIVM
jgi:hypothetical protein